MATAQCRFCQFPLMLDMVPPGETFNCPRCGGLGRVPHAAPPAAPQAQPRPQPQPVAPPAQRSRPAPAPLPPDEAPARSAKGKNEALYRIAIPLGYVLFVFVPMSLTIWYFVSRTGDGEREEPKPVAKAAPEHKAAPEPEAKKPTPPRPRPRPEPLPKAKGEPAPKTEPTAKVPEPDTEPEFSVPVPRDLTSELAVLVAAAKDPDADARQKAAKGLAVWLTRGDPSLRRTAAEALAGLKGDAQPALAALRGAEADPDADVQKFAKLALENYAAAGRRGEELAALVVALKAKEPEDRVKALRKIGTYGADGAAATDAVADALRDREKVVQDAAAAALKAINPDAEAVALCAVGLQARDPKARVAVLEEVAALGPKGKVATEYLIEAAADKVESVQAAAIKALEQANPPLAGPVAALVRGPAEDRVRAADALAELGAAAAPAVPLLLSTGERPKLWGTEAHHDVFPAVAKIAPANKRFAAAVLAAVAAPNPGGEAALTARRAAGLAHLDVIDATTAEKVAALQAAAADTGTLAVVFKAWAKAAPGDKHLTAAVLGCVSGAKPNPERVAAGLAAMDLIDVPTDEKIAALQAALAKGLSAPPVFEAFARVAPKDKRFAAAVLAAVGDPNPEFDDAVRARRVAAIAQLDAIEAAPDAKVDALLRGLADPGTVAKVFAALGHLAPKDKRVVAAVLAAVAVKNPDSTLALRERRLAAMAQLPAIDAPDSAKVDALEEALKDKGTLVPVLTALGGYGKRARLALPALKEFKSAANEGVRTAAIDAIAKIEAAVAEKP
ncbi:---NA--- : HEAT-repeat-containing PBS lyase OS=Anabaena sp. 90 GN=ANA_C10863 PE=4 SV=1 [Gemmataceae bacterium]|nr:---NA--- : HEAT-repeat-containing PBS lyase OS=Anabaena sp. 90 GN=ANA_C10863 PE=4 SV=1 [Gemmataceae bacterium]VTT97642.1 ---NA--- : HEAT-repeat-containing PBS lyase OS=Anabaena sp. 90 GN=ANA_C10863 PE=4 SV=1 [Gemmataceae bacterium]